MSFVGTVLLMIPVAAVFIIVMAYLLRGTCCEDCNVPLESLFIGYYYEDLACPHCNRVYRRYHEKHRGRRDG